MMWFTIDMTIHTGRLDIITIEQHRRVAITIITTDRRHLTITIRIMAIAISRSDHLRRSVIMDHLTIIAHLLTEIVDKKSKK
jgi:hypothetical protein